MKPIIKTSVLSILSILFLLACKKYKALKGDDPFGSKTEYVYGRLFLLDTLTQRALNTPLANKVVTISYKGTSDELNYMFSTTTNAEGYFQFKSLKSDSMYRINYSETIDGKLYTATAFSNAPNDTCSLIARLAVTGQVGMLFNIQDSTGLPLANASVCVSTSPISYNNNSCEGSNFTVTSDMYGKAAKFNLTMNTYYVLAKITINNILFQAKKVVTVDKDLLPVDLQLRSQVSNATNGINFVVIDETGNPMNKVNVCLFRSSQLYERDTCDGSNYSTATNAAGMAAVNNIMVGRYFVLADLSLTQFRMLGRDTIIVEDKTMSDTIYIKKH